MTKEKNSLLNLIRNPHQPDNPRVIIKDRLFLLLFLIGLYFIFGLFAIRCPLKFMTGISCPGCGMTRAYTSLLVLDFKRAFHYHPLFLLVPPMVTLYLLDAYLNPKLMKITWAVIIIIFLIVYFIRLLLWQNDIVNIDFSNSKMFELFKLLQLTQ